MLWVKRFLRNQADVEDVVQETFVRSYIHLVERDIQNPTAYLFTTAKNLALKQNALSVNRLSDTLDELELFESIDLDDPVMQQIAAREEMSWLCEAIRELPLQCRKVFILKKVYGFSHKEIANHLVLSENTVHQHLAKGVSRCTLYMSTHGYNRSNKKNSTVVNIVKKRI